MKRALGALFLALLVGAAGWTLLVVSHNEALGTDNQVRVQRLNTTNNVTDTMAELSFIGEAEALDWSLLTVEVTTPSGTESCGFGLESSNDRAGDHVTSTLSPDGATFTVTVDATDDASFVHLDLPNQNESTSANYTARFSTTSVFLAEGVRWAYLDGHGFSEPVNVSDVVFSNDTEEKLAWYDYDLAVHRVTPKDGLFLLEVDDVVYRLAFTTYYNDADEGRHPTFRFAAEEPDRFPALNDPDRVTPSSCLIVTDDEDAALWNGNETLHLVENGVELAALGDAVEVLITYEGQPVETVVAEAS